MADLDDLLDGPPPTSTAKAAPPPPPVQGGDIDELDDLIGGDASPSTANKYKDPIALDDDFLGGGGNAPRRVTGSMMSFGSSGSGETGADTASTATAHHAVASTGGAGHHAPISKPKIAALSEAPSEKLKPFVIPGTSYFARFVSLFDADLKKTRAVLHLTESHVQLIQPGSMQILRSIPIGRVVGVLKQAVLVSKTFSFAKEQELHMVLQISHERDVYVSLTFDQENGGSASSLDIVKTLSSLTMAYGVALSVSELHQDENIEGMVKWSDGEDKIRRQLSETLAFRTELQSELQSIARMDGQLTTSIETLKSSSATQAADDLLKDMDSVRKILSDFSAKLASIERSRTETQKLVKSLQGDLEREEHRRAANVRETMEKSAQSQLMRQVAEYEIMKLAHKRDIDKIAAVTSFNERRVSSRQMEYEIMKLAHKRDIDKIAAVTSFNERRVSSRQNKVAFAGNQLGLRIDDLEDEEAQLLEMRAAAAQKHADANLALTEAKKRLAQAKGALAGLQEDIQVLSDVPASEPLPSTFKAESAPMFATVSIASARPQMSTIPSTPPPSTPLSSPPTIPAAAPVAAAAARAPIILDDDDDI
ncbi:Hypothetical protein, putative [Bodo saltans]|uniref:Uncharacterized protein n=1 Tax=Bodo saltans TaxID=75058 RepID=A0A0S4JC32_BODSA|nr:Hypothetical protein, putative [Bodo saltans]|eukprot:CUG87739.1 Hypothetical protein, putative [Bodo saltans]